MDDLISRQTLLNKFEPWLKVKDYNDGELNMLKAVLYEIRFMRPAQPKIIRCKDCKHRDPENKKCDCGHDILWQLPRRGDWFCADGER